MILSPVMWTKRIRNTWRLQHFDGGRRRALGCGHDRSQYLGGNGYARRRRDGGDESMTMHVKLSSPRTRPPVECKSAQRGTTRRCMRIVRWGRWLFLTVPMLVGCSGSQPAIAKANVKLVEKLRAAVTAKNTD